MNTNGMPRAASFSASGKISTPLRLTSSKAASNGSSRWRKGLGQARHRADDDASGMDQRHLEVEGDHRLVFDDQDPETLQAVMHQCSQGTGHPSSSLRQGIDSLDPQAFGTEGRGHVPCRS